MCRVPLALLVTASLLVACGEPVVGGRLDAPPADVPDDLAPPDVPVGADVPDEPAAPDAAPDVPVDVASDLAPMDVPADMLPPGACRADADCAMNADGAVCDPATMRCVQCLPSRDVCPTGQYCEGTRCQAGCRDDSACAELAMSGGDGGVPDVTPDGGDASRPPSLRCAPATRTCVECLEDAHCGAGNLCAGNVCVPGCNAARACPAGLTCCAGACVDPQTNVAHCGACGTTCGGANAVPACLMGACTLSMCVAPFEDCDGMVANGCETDTRASLAHCGACNRACAPRANASVACEAGDCRYACAAGFADCDGDPANGCEADTRAATAHCGACGRRCDVANGAAACRMGACAVDRCDPGFGDCDGAADNGCETPFAGAPAHCGACGNACPTRPNAPPACVMGACATVCAAGFADCDGDATNGCEADLRVSLAHCGACDRACRPASASGSCVAGACAVRACDAGRGDCDGNAANGCETDTATALTHCGACGTSCPGRANAATTCAAGACGFTCNAGAGDCNRDASDGCETDTRASAAHCGGCGMACAARANATASCAAGTCAYACNPGFADCDGNPANGCEVNTRTDANHCGACNSVCRVAGGAGVCASGSCSVSACDPGRGDCDGSAANGCETDLTANLRACGACGTACPAPAGSTATCAAGACGFACNAGLGDCNRVASDGCETDTRASAAHCGGCGMACAARANATASCAAGTCAYACNPGFADCDGNPANGCETDTRASLSHCGACGRACTITGGAGACVAGACQVARCDAGRADCDLSAATGCETITATDPRACGACGVVCPARPSATSTCAGGACGFACVAGFADCNGAAGDGCEVDTRASTAHCGGCGRACAARANAATTCAGGSCAYACNAGFADCDGNAANGCETDTRSNPSACGACGRACAVANGTAGCSGGACTVASCRAGFGNCDGNPANGCEVAHDTNSAHCGACGRSCPGGQSCYAGRCSATCGDTRALAPAGCTNLAPSGGAFASSSSAAPPFANDGNLCTAWNAGNYAPRWWAVDLGAVRTFRGVTLVAEMLPNGAVTHVIEVSNNGSSFTAVRTISQTMVNAGLYTFDLGSVTGRYVRISSTSSPSWIAWREVAVYSCP